MLVREVGITQRDACPFCSRRIPRNGNKGAHINMAHKDGAIIACRAALKARLGICEEDNDIDFDN